MCVILYIPTDTLVPHSSYFVYIVYIVSSFHTFCGTRWMPSTANSH